MDKQLITQQKVWQNHSLKSVVDEIIKDPKFVGLSRYLHNIEIFWSTVIPTACAGHGFIFFNPNFFDSIPPETRITVMAHEVWHLILQHLDRGKGYDAYTYNVAGDHVINIGLKDDGFTFEGSDPCLDTKYRGMSTEEIYYLIYKKVPININKHISNETIEDLIQEALDIQQLDITLEDQQIIAAGHIKEINKDVQSLAGSTSGFDRIELEYTRKLVVIEDASYEEIFKDCLTDPLGQRKSSFSRPSKRQSAIKNSSLKIAGRLKKNGKKNRLKHLTYALDVSGSISKKMAQQFHDSVRTIKELLKPKYLTVIFFDTEIKLEKTFGENEAYTKMVVRAGGGTSLQAVYKRAAALKSEALVIFTDLEVSIPPQPEWDTIWIVPNGDICIPPDIYGNVYRIPKQ